jgi:hypothetical protein
MQRINFNGDSLGGFTPEDRRNMEFTAAAKRYIDASASRDYRAAQEAEQVMDRAYRSR